MMSDRGMKLLSWHDDYRYWVNVTDADLKWWSDLREVPDNLWQQYEAAEQEVIRLSELIEALPIRGRKGGD